MAHEDRQRMYRKMSEGHLVRLAETPNISDLSEEDAPVFKSFLGEHRGESIANLWWKLKMARTSDDPRSIIEELLEDCNQGRVVELDKVRQERLKDALKEDDEESASQAIEDTEAHVNELISVIVSSFRSEVYKNVSDTKVKALKDLKKESKRSCSLM